jgi:rare lipoprotein A
MPSIGRVDESAALVEALWGAMAVRRRHVVRWAGLMGAAASLAACAQSSVVNPHTAFAPSYTRQAAFERARRTHISVVRRHVAPPENHLALAKPSRDAGLASFYTESSETASGEKYDPHELTAAHPTLPFGTKLRVTNTTTGRSVTVRVNDRGPFVRGRVVDVSYSAAQALGMVNSGTANVKLDVVQ